MVRFVISGITWMMGRLYFTLYFVISTTYLFFSSTSLPSPLSSNLAKDVAYNHHTSISIVVIHQPYLTVLPCDVSCCIFLFQAVTSGCLQVWQRDICVPPGLTVRRLYTSRSGSAKSLLATKSWSPKYRCIEHELKETKTRLVESDPRMK